MGGYPSLDSLLKGVLDMERIVGQTDASDRAFLRVGMSCDGSQCKQVKGFHPLMHALRQSMKVKSDREAWVKMVKQDLWDAVSTVTSQCISFSNANSFYRLQPSIV